MPIGLPPQKEPEFYRFSYPGSTKVLEQFQLITMACKNFCTVTIIYSGIQ